MEMRYVSAIMFYDQPLLMLFSGDGGTKYLALLVEETKRGSVCLCIPFTLPMLADLTEEKLDLNKVFSKPMWGEYYLADMEGDRGSAKRIYRSDVPDEWIPLPGTLIGGL